MIPIVSVVGKSDSGKTFLIERLVSSLTGKGYQIATVKHDVHGFDMDREGKDSWRHKQAGAALVVVSSPKKIAVIQDVEEEQSLERIRATWIRGVDLILTEGYKRARYPKIEVALFGDHRELLCTEDDGLIAVVSNREITMDVPVFREAEIPRCADWVEERFLKNRPGRGMVSVLGSGQTISLTESMEEQVRSTLHRLLSDLGVPEAKGEIEIRISGVFGREGLR